MRKLRVMECFGGIGACSKALEKLGIDYEIADYVEIDKYAVKSFNAIHNTNFEPQDITQWNKDIQVDLVMHGSPCQDFSLAGLQAGGDEGSGTRSSLMYETIRIVKKLKPKYVIWENVKNLLSKKHRHNFDTYLEIMESLGYANYYQVLNAKDYGIPQNRERVFTISIRNDIDKDFIFPEKQELKLKLKDMLEDNVDEKYYLSDIAINKIKKHKNKIIENENPNESSTIPAGYYKMGGRDQQYIKEPMIYDDRDKGWGIKISDICPTQRAMRTGIKCIYPNLKIRKLTPKECWNLMGFDDEDFNKASKVNSNAQLYKQAGNSIVVNVLMAIFNELLKKEGE